MQHIRDSILRHVRLTCCRRQPLFSELGNSRSRSAWCKFVSTNSTNSDELTARVVQLVKKFDKIDPHKVTESADFQKDLSLDSLDRVELVMAFEQEFAIEIPDEKADKLTCCADVVNFILTESESKIEESS